MVLKGEEDAHRELVVARKSLAITWSLDREATARWMATTTKFSVIRPQEFQVTTSLNKPPALLVADSHLVCIVLHRQQRAPQVWRCVSMYEGRFMNPGQV